MRLKEIENRVTNDIGANIRKQMLDVPNINTCQNWTEQLMTDLTAGPVEGEGLGVLQPPTFLEIIKKY